MKSQNAQVQLSIAIAEAGIKLTQTYQNRQQPIGLPIEVQAEFDVQHGYCIYPNSDEYSLEWLLNFK